MVIEASRVHAAALPESETQSVVATLKSITVFGVAFCQRAGWRCCYWSR
jgi:hypothetical protein